MNKLDEAFGFMCIHISRELLFHLDGLKTPRELVAAFHTPGLRGKNLQATRCVLGGKYRVKVVTLFLTPPFMPTPNQSQGG